MYTINVNVRKILPRAAASLVCLMLAFLCSSVPRASGATSPLMGGTLITGGNTQPSSLNPILDAASSSLNVMSKMFIPLTDNALDGSPLPGVAMSWDVSEDELTYTFHLWPNMTWHDGEPVTSEDVRYSFEELIPTYHKLGASTFGAAVESYEVIDDKTIVFHLKYLFPVFRYTFLGGFILPAHIYKGTDIMTNPANNDPVGNGPFVFQEWVRGSHITMVRNPNYYIGGQPYLDKIVYRYFADPGSLILAMESGECDHEVGRFPLTEYARFTANPEFDTYVFQTIEATEDVFFFNLRRAPVNDANVRHAIAHAINRDALSLYATNGLNSGDMYSIVTNTPSMLQYINPNVTRYEYDVDLANAMLDNAGYPIGTDGSRFSLDYYTFGLEETSRKLGEVIKDNLKDIGVDVNVHVVTKATWGDVTAKTRDFDMAHLAMSTGPHPIYTLRSKFHGDFSNSTDAYRNCMGYNNTQVNTLWDQAMENPTKAVIDQIQEIIMEDLPFVPLLSKDKLGVYRTTFAGSGIEKPHINLCPLLSNVWWTLGTSIPEPAPSLLAVMTDALPIVLSVVAIIISVYTVLNVRSLKRRE